VERLRQILALVASSGLTDHHTMAFFVQVTPTKQNRDYTTPLTPPVITRSTPQDTAGS
jgi:hypothetical protein